MHDIILFLVHVLIYMYCVIIYFISTTLPELLILRKYKHIFKVLQFYFPTIYMRTLFESDFFP